VFRMKINRDDLQQLIDSIYEEDAAEVYDFIGYLNMKREREAIGQIDFDSFFNDKELINQVQKSREERTNGLIYDQKQGLKYLQKKTKEFEKILG